MHQGACPGQVFLTPYDGALAFRRQGGRCRILILRGNGRKAERQGEEEANSC